MSDYVVDSSVVVKLLIPEPDSADAHRFAHDVISRLNRLIVLDLAPVEMANAIWKRFHRGLISAQVARHTTTLISTLPLVVEHAIPILLVGQEIALKYDRATYDSLFVALSHHLQLPGITADEPLWNAVKTDFPHIMLLRDWPNSTP